MSSRFLSLCILLSALLSPSIHTTFAAPAPCDIDGNVIRAGLQPPAASPTTASLQGGTIMHRRSHEKASVVDSSSASSPSPSPSNPVESESPEWFVSCSADEGVAKIPAVELDNFVASLLRVINTTSTPASTDSNATSELTDGWQVDLEENECAQLIPPSIDDLANDVAAGPAAEDSSTPSRKTLGDTEGLAVFACAQPTRPLAFLTFEDVARGLGMITNKCADTSSTNATVAEGSSVFLNSDDFEAESILKVERGQRRH